MKTMTVLLLNLSLILLNACSERSEKAHAAAAAGNSEKEAGKPAADPNRMDVPESVRQNLGLTFAKVERRRVASTMRVPGRFEALPSARREYNAVVPGRVELLVKQYQTVEPGTVLYRIQSPEWLKLRQQLAEELSAIKRTEAEVAVAQATMAEAQRSAELLKKRIEALAGAEVRRVEIEAQLADKANSVPRLEAEVRAKQAEHETAQQRFPLTLVSAAALMGTTPEALLQNEGSTPRWRTISHVEIKAAEAGVVESFGLTNGAWIEANKLVLATINPSALRFRAVGLQADLGKLREGLSAAIILPAGTHADDCRMDGKLALGLVADPESRTVDLIVPVEKPCAWARVGISALLEVAVNDSEDPELAIPVAAVIQDELTRIFFRRDPKNPDVVIRTEADMGTSDGHWIIVNSGLKAGDEVVVDGVYELKLASSAKGGVTGKGHFHADGTYVVHQGKDGEKKE